jgi:hypothetical protein
VRCRTWSSRIACTRAAFNSQTAPRKLRSTPSPRAPLSAVVAEPCAARQAELEEVPTLRGPRRLQVFCPLDPGFGPAERAITSARADHEPKADARSRSDSPPKRPETRETVPRERDCSLASRSRPPER